MSTATLLDNAAWLAERKKSIGASEAAMAVGLSPFGSPIDLWQRKTGRAPEQAGNEAMRWGTLLEPLVLAEYERITGEAVGRRQEFCRHPILPFLTATLDGVTAAGKVVEAKTTSAWARGFGDEDADEVPDHYRVQVQHQLAVTGAAEADLVVLIGGQRLRVYPLTRDDDLINAIEDRLEEFWACVQRDTPPDWGRLDAGALAVLHPDCEGVVELDQDAADEVQKVDDANYLIKRHEKVRDDSRLRVLALMGSHEFGVLPDGRRLRRYLQEVPERTATTKAHTRHYYRVLKGETA